jgi:hypothetical protein
MLKLSGFQKPPTLCDENSLAAACGTDLAMNGKVYLSMQQSVNMEAFLPGRNTNLDFRVKEIEGTYRLARGFYRIDQSGRELELPLKERISKEFQLIRQP